MLARTDRRSIEVPHVVGDFFPEDTVLLLDTSRSMMISDFKPRRLQAMLVMARNFIEQKMSIDYKDRIAVVTIGQRARKVADFQSDATALRAAVREHMEISGKGNAIEGLAFAVQMLAKEIQKIGGKVQRVFIITDNKVEEADDRLKKLAQVADGLGIFIDCALIGALETNESVFKDLASVTGGEFGYFKNDKALAVAGKAFASKKSIEEDDLFSLTQKQKEAPKLLSEIAVTLRRPGIGELRLIISGKVREKCQICFSDKSPSGSPFFTSGRYCPNCGRAMHLECAAQWAQKTDFLAENVFRCPFCYFLLKVPKKVTKLINGSGGTGIPGASQAQDVQMVQVDPNAVDQIDESCSWCNSIFTGEVAVFQCSHCGAYYHEPCLQEMYKQVRACRSCGGRISSA